jgi:hypothetical protein
MIGDLRVPVREASPWTFKDAASPYFAGPAVMALRDCTLAEHFVSSKSLVRSYHSVADKLIPIGEKRKFWAALDGKTALRTIAVTPDMLDGRLFKTVEHGMEASLLDMMADAMTETPFAGSDADTDFERETERRILSVDRTYRLRFASDLSFDVSIEPL